jgi:hypothetical protein
MIGGAGFERIGSSSCVFAERSGIGVMSNPYGRPRRAVDDEMKAAFRCGEAETDIEMLATAGDGCVVGSFEVKSHQRQD